MTNLKIDPFSLFRLPHRKIPKIFLHGKSQGLLLISAPSRQNSENFLTVYRCPRRYSRYNTPVASKRRNKQRNELMSLTLEEESKWTRMSN